MNLSPAWRRHIRVSPISKAAFLADFGSHSIPLYGDPEPACRVGVQGVSQRTGVIRGATLDPRLL
jgi:hypothetical protein